MGLVVSGRFWPLVRPALAAYRIAKNLALGLGWIYYTQGLLHLALPVHLTARALVLPTKDELQQGLYRTSLWLCSTLAAGCDPKKLTEAK